MNSIFFWIGALIVVTVLRPFLKHLIAAVAGKQIGALALSRQPDTIHLVVTGPEAWKDAVPAKRTVDGLIRVGFQDAHVHLIEEMPGVVVQMMAHVPESFYACVYQHPQAGTWFDIVSRFQDGTSITWTTSKPSGLDPRPGHAMVNLPGLDPSIVFEKARATRPRRQVSSVSASAAVGVFEIAYAESMAWRKNKGVTNREAVKVAGADLKNSNAA